jgi:N-acylneuraminate cytidylyltransferase
MKILGIISARGGSKGVPEKNIKFLGTKPLIAYTIENALQSELLTKVIVSTDNEAIATISKRYGAEIPFIRPIMLATDSASSIDVVKHAIVFFENKNEFFDAICLLQPTTPFREMGMIDNAIKTFVDSNCDGLVSVLPVPHEYNPHWVFEANKFGQLKIATGDKEIIKRRQDLPKSFFRDGAIYLSKIETIKNGSFFGNNLGFVESNPDFYVNIDTMKDWELAKKKLAKIQKLL